MNATVCLVLGLAVFAQSGPAPKSARSNRGVHLENLDVPFVGQPGGLGRPLDEALDLAAKGLLKGVEGHVLLVGHSSNVGGDIVSRRIAAARANVLKQALVKRGVAASKLSVFGIGASETAARVAPRRVELWVLSDTPVAHLTWTRGEVQVGETPAVPPLPAEHDMALLGGYRVEVPQEAAAEFTMANLNTVHVAAGSSAIINDVSQLSRKERRTAADIELERGEARIRLIDRRPKSVTVSTPTARIVVRSGRVRIHHDASDGTTRVSVERGAARVFAGRRRVGAVQGQTVRVVKSKAPVARRFAAAPTWDMTGPALVIGGSESELYWKRGETVATVELQFARFDDERFERPVRVARTPTQSAKLAGLPLGAYRVRLVGVDADGMPGAAGPPMKLLVLPEANALGLGLHVQKGVVQMPGPGYYIQRGPPQMPLTLGPKERPAGPEGLPLFIPGKYDVPYRVQLEDGSVYATGRIEIRVAEAAILFSPLEPVVTEDLSRTKVRFRVLGDAEQPIPGLHFTYAKIDDPLPSLPKLELKRSGERTGPLQRCDCDPLDNAPTVRDEGDGYYIFDYDRAPGNVFRTDLVRIMEVSTRLVQEVDVPIGAWAEVIQQASRSGFTAAVRVGSQIVDDDALTVRADIQLGGRLSLYGPLGIDLGVQAGWFRTPVRVLDETQTQTANVLPAQGRVAFVVDFDTFGFYAGGTGGAAIAFGSVVGSADKQIDRATVLWSALGGAFVSAGRGEVFLESFASPVTLGGRNAKANLGFGAMLGYRFKPWVGGSGGEIDVGESPGLDADFLDVGDL